MTHLYNNSCVLPANNQKLIVLNILPLPQLARSDTVSILRVLKDHKSGHFRVKLIIMCDSFFKLILVDIREWTINNVGRCSFETMNINEKFIVGSKSFPNEKQPKNSLPNVLSMS
jgi:hypothetical protein